VPEHLRERLSGWLNTGTPIGFLLASAASLIHLVGLFGVKWAPETAPQALQK
jgi:hypothetical protein